MTRVKRAVVIQADSEALGFVRLWRLAAALSRPALRCAGPGSQPGLAEPGLAGEGIGTRRGAAALDQLPHGPAGLRSGRNVPRCFIVNQIFTT